MLKPGPDAGSGLWNSSPGSFLGFLGREAAPPKPSPVPRAAAVLQTPPKRPAAGRKPGLEGPVPSARLPLEQRGLFGWNPSRFGTRKLGFSTRLPSVLFDFLRPKCRAAQKLVPRYPVPRYPVPQSFSCSFTGGGSAARPRTPGGPHPSHNYPLITRSLTRAHR